MFKQFMLYYSSVDPGSIFKRYFASFVLWTFIKFTDNSSWFYENLANDKKKEFEIVFKRNLEKLKLAEIEFQEEEELYKSRIINDPIRKSMRLIE